METSMANAGYVATTDVRSAKRSQRGCGMDPHKEAKYLLIYLVEHWGYYADGWAFSVTYQADSSFRWELKCERTHTLDGITRHTCVTEYVTREEWEMYRRKAIEDAAEKMYMDSFKEVNWELIP
jgi:hypothetical protein